MRVSGRGEGFTLMHAARCRGREALVSALLGKRQLKYSPAIQPFDARPEGGRARGKEIRRTS
jgi:hypothetical protein